MMHKQNSWQMTESLEIMPVQVAQRVLDRRTSGKYVYYLIQWKNSDITTSWEPLHNCNSFIHLVKQYNRRMNRKKNNQLMMRNRTKVQNVESSSSQSEEYSPEDTPKVKKSKKSKKVTRVYRRKLRDHSPKKKESRQIVRGRKTRESEKKQKEQEQASKEQVRQPELKIEKMLLRSGEFWCDISSRNGRQRIKKAEVLNRNYMALIEFYEQRIRF